jgi:hypothetical protein
LLILVPVVIVVALGLVAVAAGSPDASPLPLFRNSR